jgi:hypothetical protein
LAPTQTRKRYLERETPCLVLSLMCFSSINYYCVQLVYVSLAQLIKEKHGRSEGSPEHH